MFHEQCTDGRQSNRNACAPRTGINDHLFAKRKPYGTTMLGWPRVWAGDETNASDFTVLRKVGRRVEVVSREWTWPSELPVMHALYRGNDLIAVKDRPRAEGFADLLRAEGDLLDADPLDESPDAAEDPEE